MGDGNRIGYVINRGSPDNFVSVAFMEELIRTQFELRAFPKERVVFEKVIGSGKRQTQLWTLNWKEGRPTHGKIYDSYTMADQKTPLVIAEYGDGEGSECPEIDYERFVARFLRDNLSSRLNIDISAHKLERAKRDATKIVRKLVGKFGIARKRIRIFARSDKRNYYSWPIVKYWYLP